MEHDPSTARPTRVAHGDGYEVWRSRKGEMRLAYTNAGAVCIIVDGHADGGYAPAIVDACDRVMGARASITLFFDWEEVPSYDSQLRIDLTNWTLKHLKAVQGIHLFTRSKIVRMGASVANLVLRSTISVHESRGSFETAAARFSFPRPPRA
jgi:hypothetical protein